MSKDYANRANSKAKTKSATRGNVSKKRAPIQKQQTPTPSHWLIVAVVVAVFIGGLSYLKKHQEGERKNDLHKPSQKSQVVKMMPQRPEFDFYTILPREKVWEPKNSADDASDTPAEPSAPTAYILQVAAFQQYATADQFKAKLLMEGYAAQVDAKPTNGWYRVWIGPLKNLADAQDMQMKTAQTDKAKGIILQVPVN